MRIILTVLLLQLGSVCFGQLHDSTKLIDFANKFVAVVQSGDLHKVQRLSIPDIYCSLCFKDHTSNSTVNLEQFISFAKEQHSLWKRIVSSQPSFGVVYFKEQKVYELLYTTTNKDEQQIGHGGGQTVLQFIKTKEEFKFFGLTTIP